MTLSDFETAIWNRMEDNTLFYPAAEVSLVVHEVMDISNLFAGHYQGYVDIAGGTVANQVIYDVPANMLLVLAVWFAGVELQKTTLAALAGRNRQWLRDTTATTGQPVSAWAPVGMRKFALSPADAVAGNALRIFGVLEPADLTDESPVPLPTGFEDIALEYGAHRLPYKEGGKPFADATKVLPHFQRKLKESMRWTEISFPRFWIERTEAQK